MAGFEYENQYWWQGEEYVVGLDEVGRGSIAGPLVVAAVIFPAFYDNYDINDSKMLNDKQRRKLVEIIKRDALAYVIEVISVEEVDQYNIYAATQIGMERAIKRLPFAPGAILTDAMPLPNIKGKPLEAIIKGDQKSVTIAAASILAKVTRDDMMIELSKQYPGYGWDKNKGYCTPQHVKALEELGIVELHRKTYSPVSNYVVHDVQISLDDILQNQ